MKKKPKDRHLDVPAEANRDKHINFVALENRDIDPSADKRQGTLVRATRRLVSKKSGRRNPK